MSDFEITYAAHTATCTFLLDSEGICRSIVNVGEKQTKASKAAQECVNAQYVASLDPMVSGMLSEMPRAGAAMLFARVDSRGRVSLVRSGVVTRFERYDEVDPFIENTSAGVSTSAPPIDLSGPSPRFTRARETSPDLNRTDELEALPPQESHERVAQTDSDEISMERTSEYKRMTLPSNGVETLRQPPAALTRVSDDDETDPYQLPARKVAKTPPPPPPPSHGRTRKAVLPPPPRRRAAK